MKIRPYQESDEQGIFKLDRSVEEHEYNRRDIENWEWKYKGANPAGDAIIYVCENKDEIIAHFAAIPMKYWSGNQEVTASHSIAMMVKPEWQKRGLVKFVTDKVIKELEEKQIPFTYGYPNEAAHLLHKTFMAYEDITMQKLYQVDLNSERPKMDLSLPEGVKFSEIDKFDAFVDALWNNTKNDYNTLVVRTADFLNWRYIARPDIKYHAFGLFKGSELLGYCILKLYQDGDIQRGHFVDIFTTHADISTFQMLVAHGLGFFEKQNCTECNLWLQGHAGFQDALKQSGFDVVSSRPLICRFNHEKEKYEKVLNDQNWYFTMGDTLEIY
jgi:hypothetical protein